MKRQILTILGLSLLLSDLPVTAQPPGARPDDKKPASTNDYSKIFKNDQERNGYAIGVSRAMHLTESLKRNDIEFDTNAVIRGFTETISGPAPLINEAQVQEIINILQRDVRARAAEKQKEMQEKMRLQGETNKKEGEEFLARKKTEPGVIPLPSGLMYKVINAGKGTNSPKLNDTVMVNYRGTFTDGTEFDNSDKAGRPFSTRVNPANVIKGWVEALQLMTPGAKWQLFIPPDLAYSTNGHLPVIAPNATLVFDVELLSVQPAPPAPPLPPQGTPPSAPLTSDIIKVPSAEELKKGAKIETIKAADIEKERAKEAAKTNK